MRANYQIGLFLVCYLVSFTTHGKDAFKGLSITAYVLIYSPKLNPQLGLLFHYDDYDFVRPYAPIWPHELPCYCYTNVVEVYKSTSEWIRSSVEFRNLGMHLGKEEMRMLDMPNTTLFLPLPSIVPFEKGMIDMGKIKKHLVEGMKLSVADFDFGTSRVRRPIVAKASHIRFNKNIFKLAYDGRRHLRVRAQGLLLLPDHKG